MSHTFKMLKMPKMPKMLKMLKMLKTRKWWIGVWLLTLFTSGMLWAQTLPAVAFFYGANPPWGELQAFDSVVVDPDHVPQPTSLRKKLPHTTLVAYVALGEVQPSRAYADAIPKNWLLGENKDWGSRVIDQSQAAWPAFFVDKVIAPLWDKGYRSFFLDTLDSYHLVAKTPEQRALQEAGMAATIEALKNRYPQAQLIFNRGFEILPSVHRHVQMVVAESLFQGYDAGKQSYKNVSEEDRAWLLGQLQKAQKEYKLPVMSIDYVHPAQRELARETAKKIEALGIIPWVTEPTLASLGVGSVEVMPRKILVLHSRLQNEFKLHWVEALRVGAMPINYLGYSLEFVDPDQLPQGVLTGRYAGVIVWMNDAKTPPVVEQERITRWLTVQVENSLPIALVNPDDFMIQDGMDTVLGLTIQDVGSASKLPIKITQQSSMMGFETPPRQGLYGFPAIQPPSGSESLLTLQQGSFQQVVAAITPWGGYVLESFSIITLPGNTGDRWVINPFAFFEKALRLPPMPVPDVTTEAGRRMLMVHMDGDGFISRAEIPGTPLASDVLLNRFIKKYPIPMTISVIESEISPQGLHPHLSKEAEKIAKEMYKQPHVAIASHSYSHPFFWHKAMANDDEGSGYNLSIPGYEFSLEREIKGSVKYIESRLAPLGKKVEVFLWTGDCLPGSDALRMVTEAGMVNMNGGDTVATKSNNSVAAVEGLGTPRTDTLQIYAPNQNENVYTNNWTGPFYGFDRVIETFEFTESPRRLKPIDIYFHTYLVTKMAGIKSLEKIFNYALAQDVTPVHITDYAYKVQDFHQMAVAKSANGWRIRGAQNLRTLRMPSSIGSIQMADSRAVAGFRTVKDKDKDYAYVHLSGDWAEIAMGEKLSTTPYLVSANAKIEKSEFQKGRFIWNLKGYVPLKFELHNAEKCQVRQTSQTNLNASSSNVTSQIEAICP
ncbi:MAG: hypothetical protein RIR79_150 [Pseudomonadota bacterium]